MAEQKRICFGMMFINFQIACKKIFIHPLIADCIASVLKQEYLW